MLLPLPISYPNHSPYMPIDYRSYPAAHTLRRISFWTLTIHVDDARNVQVAQASRGLTIDVE
jgi:hypothetical protein